MRKPQFASQAREYHADKADRLNLWHGGRERIGDDRNDEFRSQRRYLPKATKRAHARLRLARKGTRVFTPDPLEDLVQEPTWLETLRDREERAQEWAWAEIRWLDRCHQAALDADNAEEGWQAYQAAA
jgi:hypothetical protein